MKVLQFEWFTLKDGKCIGIVLGEDEVTKKRKAYIGVGQGQDEELDVHYIKSNGTPVSANILESMLIFLKEES